jgi:hypothetical protein
VVECVICSSKATRGEDLQVEYPICAGSTSALDFHPTWTSVLGSTVIRDQVRQGRQSGQQCLLPPFGRMEALHHAQLPLDGVVGLIQERAGHGYTRIVKPRIPPRLLGPAPAPDTCAVHCSRCG